MPILSIDVNAPGMSGVKPKAIFIDTNDTASEVIASGYLDHVVAQGTPLSNSDMALVTTRPSPNSSNVTTAWYGISHLNGKWSLVSQGGGSGGLQSVSVPMTSSEFKNLLAAPKLIVAPPGVGKLIIGYSIVIELLWGTTQYANGSEVALYYGNGDILTAAVVSDGTSAAIFNFVTYDTIISNRMYVYGTEYYYDATLSVNTGVYLRVDTTDFTTGDSNFVVHFSYEVLNVTAT